MKKEVIELISKETKLRENEIENLLEIPPNLEFGDYAFPCFILAKKHKENPIKIAERLAKNIKLTKNIEKIENKGGYVNFFIDKKELAKQIIKINSSFGKSNLGKNRKIVIDFSSPNIGKPMHIGHIRSTIIGDSLLRIFNFLNYNVIGINYLGDIGLHIGKLIIAYELWLDKEQLIKNPVKELLRLYVKFCEKESVNFQEGLEEEFQNNEWTLKAKEKLKLLELGDKKTHQIWNDIRKQSEKGFNEVYKLLNTNFHETVGQSAFEIKGKQIITNALEKSLAKTEKDGAVYVEINNNKKYILRANKTASYITYDLGAAVERFKKYNFDKMIYVTDFRQSEHFKNLFEILKKFGYDFYNRLFHVGFGVVKFGKEILASRKGNIILLKDVLDKTIQKANQEIKKRKTKGDSEKVGVASIKYLILKNEPIKDVHFSFEQALSFEGNTGPYLQYSYARASSIIKKAKNFNKSKTKIKINNLTNYENSLIKKISEFPEIIIKAGNSLNPSLIANYSFELCQIFNEFYHNCKVLKDKNETFRLSLVDSFRTCLKNSLHLLGIEVMDEM